MIVSVVGLSFKMLLIRAATIFRWALGAFGHDFPFKLPVIPPNAAPRSTSRPLAFIRKPIHARNDCSACIIPGLHGSGHVRHSGLHCIWM